MRRVALERRLGRAPACPGTARSPTRPAAAAAAAPCCGARPAAAGSMSVLGDGARCVARASPCSRGAERTASSASLPTNTVSITRSGCERARRWTEEQQLLDRAVALHAGVDHAVADAARPRALRRCSSSSPNVWPNGTCTESTSESPRSTMRRSSGGLGPIVRVVADARRVDRDLGVELRRW